MKIKRIHLEIEHNGRLFGRSIEKGDPVVDLTVVVEHRGWIPVLEDKLIAEFEDELDQLTNGTIDINP